MSQLGDKLRKAREVRVEYPHPVGPVVFVLLRPTDVDMLEFGARVREQGPRAMLRYVRGWDAVTEAHMMRGGDPHPLEFDPDALAEWVSDDIALFGHLTQALVEAHTARMAALEAATKN